MSVFNELHPHVRDIEPIIPPTERVPNRWRADPYIIYHADLLDRRKMLQGDQLSEIQIALLASVMVREAENKEAEAEDHFLQQTFIHRPELYKLYQREIEERKQDYGTEGEVQWRAPTSVSEAQEIAAEFARMDKMFKKTPKKPAPTIGKTEDTLTFLDEDDLKEMKDLDASS